MVGENLYLSKINMSFKKINLKGNPSDTLVSKKKKSYKEGCSSEYIRRMY